MVCLRKAKVLFDLKPMLLQEFLSERIDPGSNMSGIYLAL